MKRLDVPMVPRLVRLMLSPAEVRKKLEAKRDYATLKANPRRLARRRETDRAWRAANAAKVREYRRRDREKNRLRIRVYNRLWKRRHGPRGPGYARGERVASSRLTAAIVAAMRAAYAAGGVTIAQLGARYGVSQTAAWKVIRRVTWDQV